MHKYYYDGNTIYFYPFAVKCGDRLYGAKDEADAELIQTRIAEERAEAEEPSIATEVITLDMPTSEQAAIIASHSGTEYNAYRDIVERVLAGTYTTPTTVDDYLVDLDYRISKLELGL